MPRNPSYSEAFSFHIFPEESANFWNGKREFPLLVGFVRHLAGFLETISVRVKVPAIRFKDMKIAT